MILKVNISWADGADRQIPLPELATEGSSGYDIRANLGVGDRPSGLRIQPSRWHPVPTGFQIAIPAGYEAQIRSRSGLALRHGLVVLNSPGTIDSDYRGPVHVLLINLGQKEVLIAHGQRIAQLVFASAAIPSIRLVEQLDRTSRGHGGFGSTGLA